MARPLRILAPGLWYHVTNRGNGRAVIFHDDEDCQTWLDLLEAGCARYHVELHAYVVMRNHFHLFARTLEATLSEFMHQVETAYVSHYQYKYEFAGHVFQGRYKAAVVEQTAYGNAVSRYIHLNPVKVGRWRTADVKEQRQYLRGYRWSSYRAFLGLVRPHAALVIDDTLALFGEGKEARRNYARYVEEGLLRDMEDPFDDAVGQAVLGTETFVEQLRRMLVKQTSRDRQTTRSARSVIAVPPGRVMEAVAQAYGLEAEELVQRYRHSEARRVAIWLVSEVCATQMNGAQIGELFGGISRSAVAKARTRVALDMKQRRRVREKVRRIEKSIFNS